MKTEAAPRRSVVRSRAYLGGFLSGIAVTAAVDEIVFHQILGWHHFYDRSTPTVGLLSDGILHAVELAAFVAGLFVLLDARRRPDWRAGAAGAGALTGAGLFQLWDGTVNHKLLQVHQIRYDVDLLPYDLTWNAAAVALIIAGLVFTRVVSGRAAQARLDL